MAAPQNRNRSRRSNNNNNSNLQPSHPKTSKSYRSPSYILCLHLFSPTSNGICPNLPSSGLGGTGCPYNHDAVSCQECGMVMSRGSLGEHLKGKKHGRNVRAISNSNNTVASTSASRRSSITIPATTTGHHRPSNTRNGSIPPTSSSPNFCPLCSLYLSPSQISRGNHKATKSHLMKERFVRYEEARGRLEEDKMGVRVVKTSEVKGKGKGKGVEVERTNTNKTIDFGIVDLDDGDDSISNLTSNASKLNLNNNNKNKNKNQPDEGTKSYRLSIELIKGSNEVGMFILKEAVLESERADLGKSWKKRGGKRYFTPFSLTLPPPSSTLSQGHILSSHSSTLSFSLIFNYNHDHPGSYIDTLSLTFERLPPNPNSLSMETSSSRSARAKNTFRITRPVKAILGSKKDFELLKPTAPYVRPKVLGMNFGFVTPAGVGSSKTTASGNNNEGDDDEDGLFDPVIDPIPGEPPPQLSAIQWVTRLPLYEVPSQVEECLDEGESLKNRIRNVRWRLLATGFNEESFGRFWKRVLWVEECQLKQDIRRYDISGAELVPAGGYIMLEVPGLAEKRPSVLIGDRIHVRQSKNRKSRWFEGFVHRVEQIQVSLRFHGGFKPIKGQKFDVRFTVSRIPIRRMHDALALSPQRDVQRYLLPKPIMMDSLTSPSETELEYFRPFNKNLATNSAQKTGVLSILNHFHQSHPLKIVFGPPGTGKTILVVETILNLYRYRPNQPILACAPSNSAADLIAMRILQSGIVPNRDIFRLNAPSRNSGNQAFPSQLRNVSRQMADGTFCVPPVEELSKFKIIVSTCLSASVLTGVGLKPGHFGNIFIDEAGQATEPEALVSILTLQKPGVQVVLAGDPHQLGPIIRSKVSAAFGLDKSLLERLMQRDVYDHRSFGGVTCVKLTQNYRNHAAILDFPNRYFYDNELTVNADRALTHSLARFEMLPNPEFPIVFHAVKGEDEREASSPSFFNRHEITIVKRYHQRLLENRKLGLVGDNIGIISPYHSQVQKLRRVIQNSKIGSTEEFQGQERRVIIISTVRSNKEFVEFDVRHALGFLANRKRFNVSITRAQAGLIVVGDPDILGLDPIWRNFLSYIYRNRGWVGPEPEWDPTAGPDTEPSHVQQTLFRMDEIIKEAKEDNDDEENDDEQGEEEEAKADKPWIRNDD